MDPHGVFGIDRDNTFSTVDMEDITKWIHHFIQPNGIFFIFCSIQQITQWQNAINSAGAGLKLLSNSFVITYDSTGYFIFYISVSEPTRGGTSLQNFVIYAVVGYKPGNIGFRFN